MDNASIAARLKSFILKEQESPDDAMSALYEAIFEIIKPLCDDQIIRIIKERGTGYQAIKETLSYYQFRKQDRSMDRIAKLWDKYHFID